MSRIAALSSFSGRGVDFGATPPPSYRTVETQLGPIALWGLGGTTLTDEIGNRDLSVTGTPVFGITDLPSDISDGAINFNGAASATLTHDAGLQLSAFTLSLWFFSNPPDPEALQVAPLIFKSGAGMAAGKFLIHIMEGTEQVRIRTADGTTNYDLFSQEGSVRSQQKYHLCVRMDNTGLDAFLNGKYLGKITSYTGAWTVNTADLFIGSDPSLPTATLFAHVDEIALYDKMLTDTEVFGLSQTPLAPIANDNAFSVPEAASTTLDVLLNDVFRGAKADVTVQIVTQPTGGRDSVSVDVNNDVVYVADTVDADTVTTFTYQIVVGGSISATATVTTTVLDTTAPPADGPFFGLAFGDDTPSPNPSNSKLTDSTAGSGHSDFFWAERSGTVTHFRGQWRANGQTGTYSDGDGGIYTVEIRKANPSTKRPLTGASDLICQLNGYNADVNSVQWTTLAFTTQGATVKGDPYCLVYRNTHPNPGANYVSENRSIQYGNELGDADTPPPGGWTPIVLPAGLSGAGQPHKPYPTWTRFPPELTLNRNGPGHWNIRYSDGQWTGTGHLGQLASPERHVVAGTNMVRHRFRPWRTHTATGVAICIQRRNASGGSVVLTLESGPASLSSGNGTQIEQVTIPASSLFNIGALEVFRYQSQKVFWNTVNFSQNRTLSAGTIYTIRVSASGGLDGSFNAGYRGEHSNIGFSQAFDNFDDHEAGQTLSWGGWEYSLGLQVSTDSGSTWSFPTGNNRQTCPLLILCQP